MVRSIGDSFVSLARNMILEYNKLEFSQKIAIRFFAALIDVKSIVTVWDEVFLGGQCLHGGKTFLPFVRS